VLCRFTSSENFQTFKNQITCPTPHISYEFVTDH